MTEPSCGAGGLCCRSGEVGGCEVGATEQSDGEDALAETDEEGLREGEGGVLGGEGVVEF